MHSHPIAKSLSCDFATSKIFANFTINDDRRKQELQTTQPQKKTVNRYDSYFTKRKYQYDAICPGNSRTVKDALTSSTIVIPPNVANLDQYVKLDFFIGWS
jgi:hypothetical protein